MPLSSRHALAFALVPALCIGGPFVAASCTSPVDHNDAAPGPCQNGTIQLADCEPNDAGIVTERFTDEACDGLDTAEARMPAMHNDAQAPAIDAPTEGQVLSAAAWFEFTWHPTGLSYLPRTPATRAFTWTDEFTRLTTLLPAAEAHCAPFGGVAYAVIFKASNGQELLRAETANRNYAPTNEAWMRLTAAQGTITMLVEVARFSDNTVTEGPFDQATPRHFTIGP